MFIKVAETELSRALAIHKLEMLLGDKDKELTNAKEQVKKHEVFVFCVRFVLWCIQKFS